MAPAAFDPARAALHSERRTEARVNAQASTADIPVRRPKLDFEREVPRFYLEGNPVKTHFFNALNLAFPDGERFFVKAVQDHKQHISDPRLLAEIQAFSGQEGQHARQHERFFTVLARQGYDVETLLARFRKIAQLSNRRLPRALRLSITAGAEHYTASMASLVLEHDMLTDCDSTLRDLIQWHAIEEIEHKHVAYDVLISQHRYNYPLRILGFLIATAFIAIWTLVGMRSLLLQDGRARRLTRAQYLEGRRAMASPKTTRFRIALRNQLLGYFKPGFHPCQQDDLPLLERFRPEIDRRLATA
jgi:predicted metal-dependent hydrolase